MKAYVGNELELFERAVNWKQYWSALIRPYVGRAVLEIGAGIGSNTPLLISDSVKTWHCIEPDADLLSQVSDKISRGRLPPTCTSQVGTIDSIEANSVFDTILYIDVMEHIESDAEEFKKAEQHLSPGGHLIVLAPAHQALYSAFDAAIGHFRRYDTKSLRRLGQSAGLTEVRIAYLDSVGLIASFANRAMLRQSAPTEAQIRLWDGLMVPLSTMLDPFLSNTIGKTIVGIWRKAASMSA